ncbi:hypothetical protein GTO91_14040 [Heliobacterium undosum]|uniref:Uncharacterized protein n=1 Tax=Heliomicrobium undosum TaxID=121734 RepID=A0A845L722_9FIRM|nr:hypothetical protein [Heliomicrobium undosum]MZP30835.1 hypothetical protein [Heliomicrobium undosum]
MVKGKRWYSKVVLWFSILALALSISPAAGLAATGVTVPAIGTENIQNVAAAAPKLLAVAETKAVTDPDEAKIQEALAQINYFKITTMPADVTNAFWKSRGYDKPPYKSGTTVYLIRLTHGTNFVRVFPDSDSGRIGGWVMERSDIIDGKGNYLPAAVIKDKFALPNLPARVCTVTLEQNDVIECGIAGPIEGWGAGGGVQFDMLGQRIGIFSEGTPMYR